MYALASSARARARDRDRDRDREGGRERDRARDRERDIQAFGLAHLLQAHCRDLCAETGGRFAHARSPAEAAAAAAEAAAHGLPPQLAQWVRLGLVKRPSRAAAKAAACYGGDASRLTDVCRCRVAFDSLDDLAAAVGRLSAAAPVVRIVRVRPRLAPPLGPDGRGGLGPAWGELCGVVVNVCFDTDETRFVRLVLRTLRGRMNTEGGLGGE